MGQLTKMDEESAAKFKDTIKEANEFCETAKKGIDEINGLESRFIEFFVLDKKTYSIKECFRQFSVFCTKFEEAIHENKKRREQEERLAKKKAEMAKRETLPRASGKKKGGGR